jgi:hypothetical protein
MVSLGLSFIRYINRGATDNQIKINNKHMSLSFDFHIIGRAEVDQDEH